MEAHLKDWMEATEMKEAVKHARAAAEEFDALYEESAVNLLARSPDLMMLLSAYMAGQQGVVKPVEGPVEQGTLV